MTRRTRRSKGIPPPNPLPVEVPPGQEIWKLYSDESGNTGPRLMAPEQPLFVFAFIELNGEQETMLDNSLMALRQRPEIAATKEFKFKQLSHMPGGWSIIHEVGELLDELQVALWFGFVEKRFNAAGLICETFFDDAYNPYAPPEELYEGYRGWVTNKLYAVCSDSLLERFFLAARSGNVEEIRELGSTIASYLRFHHDDRVVETGKVLRAGLETCFRWDKPELFPTPAFKVFGPLLGELNRILEREQRFIEIIGDVDHQFGAGLDEVIQYCRSPELFVDGCSAYGVKGPFRNILRRTQADSTQSTGVQMADLAAGMIYRVALATSRGESLGAEILDAWNAFERLARRGWSYWVSSEEFSRRLIGPFSRLLPPFDPD